MVLLILIIALVLMINFSTTTIKLTFSNGKRETKIIMLGVIKFDIKEKTKQDNTLSKSKFDTSKILMLLKKLIKPVFTFMLKQDIKIYVDGLFYFFSPGATAILYGILNSFVYSIAPIVKEHAKKFSFDTNLLPAFNKGKIDITLKAQISFINVSVLILVIKLLPIIFKNRNLLAKVE